jgi:hypothetical protein
MEEVKEVEVGRLGRLIIAYRHDTPALRFSMFERVYRTKNEHYIAPHLSSESSMDVYA